jgi:hypothetical protein
MRTTRYRRTDLDQRGHDDEVLTEQTMVSTGDDMSVRICGWQRRGKAGRWWYSEQNVAESCANGNRLANSDRL